MVALKFETRERIEAKLFRRHRVSLTEFFVQLPDGTTLEDAGGRPRRFQHAEGKAWLDRWQFTGDVAEADKAAEAARKQEEALVTARTRQAEEVVEEIEAKVSGGKRRKR